MSTPRTALGSLKKVDTAKIDLPLTWHNPEGSKSAKIFVCKDADFSDRRQWHGQLNGLQSI